MTMTDTCPACSSPRSAKVVHRECPTCFDYECGSQYLCAGADLALPEGLYHSRACATISELRRREAATRNDLALVADALEMIAGPEDCCSGGYTERYCGSMGCTPDGCPGHDEPCSCDFGRAILRLLTLASESGGEATP